MRAAAPRRLALLGAMVALQVAWFAVRSRLIGDPMSAHVERAILWSLAAWLAVVLVPGRAARALGSGLAAIAQRDAVAFGLVAGAALAAGLATAWSQQPFTWDEPFVFPAARIAAEEGLDPFFARYATIPWLGTNHPPLVILIYAAVIRLAGPELMPLRLLTVVVGAATFAAAFAIARHLVERETALFAALVLLGSPLFERMCAAAMNDIFVTFFFTCAVLLGLAIAQPGGGGRDRGALLGAIVGAGLLSKYTMLLVYPVLGAIFWVSGRIGERRREILLALAISLAMLGVWLAAASHLGVFESQRAWVGRAAGAATRSRYGIAYALDALFTKLPSGLGVYNLPLLLLGVPALFRRGGREARMLGAWIALVCLPLVVTLPDNRYFLPAYPALAIVTAVGLARLDRETSSRALLLAWLLCAATLAYYAEVDLRQRAFLFRSLFLR